MNKESSARVVVVAALRVAVGLPIIALLFFWPAGTFNYWQAWLWLALLLLLLIGAFVYLINRDPALLARRLRTGETRPEQKRIIAISSLYLIFVLILPGFDKRFGWSNVPVWLALLADVIVLTAFFLDFLVFRVNSYASRKSRFRKVKKLLLPVRTRSSAIPCTCLSSSLC